MEPVSIGVDDLWMMDRIMVQSFLQSSKSDGAIRYGRKSGCVGTNSATVELPPTDGMMMYECWYMEAVVCGMRLFRL